MSISQKYIASDINYKITLQCLSIETEVDSGTVKDMEMEIMICYNQTMGIMGNGKYCSVDEYTVMVTLTRYVSRLIDNWLFKTSFPSGIRLLHHPVRPLT